jgi:hypothetical protein
MSATGHKRTLRRVNVMPALLPKGTFDSVTGYRRSRSSKANRSWWEISQNLA